MMFNDNPKHTFSEILDDGAWKKTRKTERIGNNETWSIRVADDESYTAEGCIVKNCPLQLDVIRRCIKLYSAPGQLVLDPFIGIGSTGYIAIEQGRNSVGFELKESYHDMALRNIEKAKLLFCSDSENGSDKQLQLFA
jgi:DNA modification methylase